MKLEEVGAVFPSVIGNHTEFSQTETDIPVWQTAAIRSGQAWIIQATEHLFQPQELRLHQREGVHFDKGCYLGQEIVARLWFKAKPKHWLHLIQSKGELPAPATQLSKDVEVVNSVVFGDGYLALVIAKPAALTELGVSVLDLPEALNGDVARPS
jgi:folate-binding protein YgfZ